MVGRGLNACMDYGGVGMVKGVCHGHWTLSHHSPHFRRHVTSTDIAVT